MATCGLSGDSAEKGESAEMVATDLNGLSRPLLHFHVCKHCGAATRREEFEGRALTSGIFLCPKCGLEGPLNVEIREVQESEPSEGK
jgi:predicted RNA-binding Zn-ribbon protein involved in translation (DUF1610 family)